MTNENTKVSVIIPSYNHASFVGKAIKSVLMQDYEGFELIIADDFSKDNSVEVIDTFVDPRISKFFLKKNLGPTDILKFLISHSKGKYIALLNSDDIWCQGKLKKQVEFLDNNPEIAACFTWADFINEDDTPYIGDRTIDLNTFIEANKSQSEWLHRFYYLNNRLCHPSIMIRKGIYSKIGFYNGAIRQLPDLEYWVRLVLNYPIHILEEIYVHHRRLSSDVENTSASSSKNYNRLVCEFLKTMEYMFDNIDNNMFIDGFSDDFIHKDSKSKEELLCEKYFILLHGCAIGNRSKILAFKLFMDNYIDDNVKNCFLEKFNYTFSDFHNDNGNTIIDLREEASDEDHVLNSSFYLSINGVYSEENKILVPPKIDRSDFIYECKLDEGIRQIRFDPIEGFFLICDRAEATINDKSIEILPQNAFLIKNSHMFLNHDPQYILNCEASQGDIIKIKLINPAFYEMQSLNLFNGLDSSFNEQKFQVSLDSIQNYYQVLKEERENTISYYENSFSWKITKPIRTIRKLFASKTNKR